jgi:choline dehydrogenase-like flavoprotein
MQFYDALVKVPECAYPNAAYAQHPRSDNLDFYYVQTGPDRFASTYLRQVGGTTWHWLGTCLRLVPDDFRLATRFGRGVDWPLDYATLEPWYGAAEHEIGVAGDSAVDLGSPRSSAYPMPEIAQTFLDRGIAHGFEGTPYEVRSTPQGRNSTERDDRPPCCGNNSCIPICPIQAKCDATVHIARAEKGGANVVAQAVVHRIEVGRDRRISAVRYKHPDGSDHRVRAKTFVLAAHAIGSPKLLLMSRGANAPHGVANSSDQVGRNLMDHPVQLSWALARDPLFPYRGPLSTSGVENTRAGDWRATRPSFRIEIGNDGWSWPTGAPISDAQAMARKGLRGDALKHALYERTARQIRFGTLTEQLPDPANRITPDPAKRDPLGIPRPRIISNRRIHQSRACGCAHDPRSRIQAPRRNGHRAQDRRAFSGRGACHGHGANGPQRQECGGRCRPSRLRPSQFVHRGQRRVSHGRGRESYADDRCARSAIGRRDSRVALELILS